MEENDIRKGVKTKLFGVLLIILGALDSMLSWRGGFAPSGIYVFLLSAGIALYAIGSIRGSIQGCNPSPGKGGESETGHAKPGS